MSLIARSIPALHGGVSQQSPLVRSTDQLEVQTNSWSSLAHGLGKRAPTELVAKLMETAPANAFVHTINRDAGEQYVVIASQGSLRVFDAFDGSEQTVEAPGGWSYLTGASDFSSDISMFTVADYTFIVNRKRVVAMAGVGDDEQADPNYYLWLNRQYGFDQFGVPYAPGAAYQYQPNQAVGGLTGTVQRFDKLPEAPAQGALYRVQGDETSGFVSYYVVRRGGVWEETVPGGLVNALDASTMPHALVRGADGVFRFAPFSWAPRKVGDTITNPAPGFVGRAIRKVFFYQNRLAFLYDENCVMSVTGDFGNFWRMSQLDYLSSDVLDIGATSTKVSILADATTHADGILLTSDQTQFSLSNGEMGLSAESIAIRPTTNYTVNIRAGLAPLGSEIYFAVERNGAAMIREYTRLSGADAVTAADVTAHCPNYIPAGVHGLIPADDINTLFVLTDGASNKVFVYQFYWLSGNEKVQSAWHEWDLGAGAKVVAGSYLRGFLFLVIQRDDGLFLERVDLKLGAHPDQTENQIHLDRRATVQGEFVAVRDRTEFVLPYEPDKDRFRLVRGGAFTGRPESLIDPETYVWDDDNVVSVPGIENAGPVVCGETYDMIVEFSTIYLRRDNVAITTGRLQIRTFTLNYRDTAYFKTEVFPYREGATALTEEILPGKLALMTGKTLGSGDFLLNRPAYHTGAYAFQVYGQNTQVRIRVTNDTYVGSTFVSAEWEALYHNRARA